MNIKCNTERSEIFLKVFFSFSINISMYFVVRLEIDRKIYETPVTLLANEKAIFCKSL